ncbi:GGDEF domain-containing protein [Vibrio sp. B1FLJ16]|uniref:GGDEF domain-containing protein n=1 Tax=Vibrio sp. B1FLJ16 TaxID=2751178 RepID=UPI0015F54F0F|nr:GGDEF domain-containing protein [Vibrio sp. B1FLJ16]CAD7817065.1 COG2199 FOG GGDEF domain [Vibrio sp. B1FLJ16]CAE6930044.1 COG2199 FOG GGDEF domain [Vibrio sp. B1FLJ16]
MERLLNKVTDADIDPSSVTGEDAIRLWEHIRLNIASNQREKAHCLIISAEFRRELNQLNESISELRQALDSLTLPEHAEDILSVKSSLCDRLVETGDFQSALSEYIKSTNIAVEYGFIDEYVIAIVGMGHLCDAYGDHDRALRYYKKIDSVDHSISSRSLRLRYKLYMLACLIKLKRTAEATNLLSECEELSILVSDKNLAGQIHLYRAKLYQLQSDYWTALRSLSNVQYTTGSSTTFWLSTMVKIETACCLNNTGNVPLANLVLSSVDKRIRHHPSSLLARHFYNAKSKISASQGKFEIALDSEKRAFNIESELIKNIPISELGAAQLRRLTRFELQLKLILSEIENKELKETTKQHKNTVAQLQQDVLTDPLTSLHNRRWLEVKLKELLLQETPFTLMVIDIDHFKSINDELSHLIGDKAIKRVSRQLGDYFKFEGASCVRFGGEEFLVILEHSNIEDAELHAENYRERIYQHNWTEILGERGLTVSVGITVHREGENTQRTFYRADKALYRAKANGRNQICTEL